MNKLTRRQLAEEIFDMMKNMNKTKGTKTEFVKNALHGCGCSKPMSKLELQYMYDCKKEDIEEYNKANTEKIEIKTFYSDWKEVTLEQAKKWINHILQHGNGTFENKLNFLKEHVKCINIDSYLKVY